MAGSLMAGGLGVAPRAVSASTSTTFSTTGTHTFTVPDGYGAVRIEMSGAQGSTGEYYQPGGGLGGQVTAVLAVTAGQVLQVKVAAMGEGGAAGPNNYYDAGAGGGASDVRVGACAATSTCGLSDRVVVAGGGGGAGGLGGYGTQGHQGGGGGSAANGDGAKGFDNQGSYAHVPGGGRGGTSSAGGGAGPHSYSSTDTGNGGGYPGSFGEGGNGGGRSSEAGPGGGGGDGWYGGGGGGGAWYGGAGGGGGSSYVTADALYGAFLGATRGGHGAVIVSHAATQLAMSAGSSTMNVGSARTVTVTFQDDAGTTVGSGPDATRSTTLSSTDATASVTGLGSVTATGGTATFTVTPTSTGSITLVASYGSLTESLTFTVEKGSQTITFSQPSTPAVYGSTFPIAPTSSAGLTVSVEASGGCSYSAGVVTMTSGTVDCTLTASHAGNAGYLPATQTRTVVASRAAQSSLLLTGGATAIYGNSVTVSIGGGSGSGALSYEVSGATCEVTTWTTTSATLHMLDGTGTCTLDVAKAADTNYSAATASHDITLSKRDLHIDAVAADKSFGDADPALDYSLRGLASADTGTVPGSGSPSCQRGAGQDAGTYTITCAAGTYDPGSGYQLKAGDTAVFTIDPRPVTVTAPSPTVRYGADVPALDPTYTNLPDGVTEPTEPAACSTEATASSEVGSYSVTCTLDDDNYEPTLVAGTYTVIKALHEIDLTAPSTAAYGSTVTVTATSSADLTVTLAVTGPCQASVDGEAWEVTIESGAGDCSISTEAAGDSNHEDAPTATTTIVKTKTPLTVHAVATTKVYGDDDPAITHGFDGLVAGDTTATAAVSGTPVCTRTEGEDVGTYAMACDVSGLTSDDYSITAASPTNFGILAANLEVTASSPTIPYGTSVPTIVASYAGLRNGDTGPMVEPTCSTTVTDTSPVGVYPSTCTGASDTNYVIAYQDGAVNIVRATQTILFPAVNASTTVVTLEASSSLPVALTASGSCTVTPAGTGRWSIDTLPYGGECRLTASQAGNTNFEPAAQVVRTFAVPENVPDDPLFDPEPVRPGLVLLLNPDGSTTVADLDTGNGSVTVSVGGVSFTLVTDSEGGAPALTAGGNMPVDGEGFLAGSTLQWWMMSTPQLVATMEVDDSGRFEGSVEIPGDLTEGDHTLRAEGLGPDGAPMGISLGVTVAVQSLTDGDGTDGSIPGSDGSGDGSDDESGVGGDPGIESPESSPETGGSSGAALLAIGGSLLVATLGGAAAFRRRRRRRGAPG